MPEVTEQLYTEQLQPEPQIQQATPQQPVESQILSNQPNPYEAQFHSEFSFISLLLGLFGLILPLFSTLAIIFGIGGIMQTHREHMKGKWMAITGIFLGFAGIILTIVAIAFGIEFLTTFLEANFEMLLGGFN